MANYLTTMRGTLAGGSLTEIFSHSLTIVSPSEPSQLAADIVEAWSEWFDDPLGAMANLFPSTVTYNEATVAAILDLTEGTVMAATHGAMPLGMVGTNASGPIPSQNSVAISLHAGYRANGAPLKGRFYLPGVAKDQLEPASAFLLPATAGALASGVFGYFGALIARGHTPSVWSRTEAKINPVTMIRVGGKVDTIRRRRNRGAETYQELPI